MPYDYPARTFCAVLDEIRSCFKTYNLAPILGLVEELQVLGNRMEAHLDTKSSYRDYRDKIREARKELKSIKSEIDLLKDIKELTK